MATLDGKKIKDTYKSLLKVGDNSTLDPTLQEVTDGEGNGTGLSINNQGDLDVSGALTTNSVSVTGGSSDDFLKGDGSIDSNMYATTTLLNNLETSLLSADAVLQDNIYNEVIDRTAADSVLEASILAEENARIAADSAEQSARELADSALQTQITSNDSDITTLNTSKVPYTGATGSVNLGEHQLSAGQVTFDQTPTGSAGVGVMRWNNTAGTLDLGLKGGAVTLQVGQENVLRVVNGTGLLLQEDLYQVVKVVGAQGQRLQVDLAQADSDLNSATSLGMITEDIQNNQEGFITTSGHVRGINTTGSLQGEIWNDGDILYLSPTIAGQVTNVKPLTPAHLIVVGFVEYAHQNNGKILVKVDNGYELEELHNVNITSVQNDDALVYDSALGYWKNDSTVSSRISSLESDTSTLQSDLSNETSNRVTGDSTLQGQIDTNDTDISNLQTSKQAISEKGQANGYAPLDSGSKIQEIYLPDSILGQLSYQGTWDANTNTPDIGSPVGNLGDYYVVNTAGTYLSVSYSVGDWIISNGTAWEKVDNTDAVTTVFGRIGAIIANESDYSGFYPLISDLTTEITARTTGDTILQNQIDAITSNDIPATLALVNQNASDILSLDGRVTTNEGNISTNTANITTVTNAAASNAVNITALDIQVTDNINAIATNVSDISTNALNIATNVADIATLNSSKQDNLTAGTGIDLTGNTVTNTAPDQTVVITGSNDAVVTGTYPNFDVNVVIPPSKYFTSVISTSTTAVANTVYVLAADLTLTLPLSPTSGDSVKISNLSGVDTCIVAANGRNIMAVSQDLTLDSASASFELVYTDAANGWVIIGL